MRRIFTSIDLPAAAKKYLKSIQKKDIYTIKWVSADNTHLTLNFLGELDESEIESAKEVVSRVAPAYQPFQLRFSEIIANREMLWLVPEKNQDLMFLQSELKNGFKSEGLGKSERRPYWPHLMLAKTVKRGRKMRLDKIKNLELEPFEVAVDAINIYESVLTPGAATHTLIARLPLGETQNTP